MAVQSETVHTISLLWCKCSVHTINALFFLCLLKVLLFLMFYIWKTVYPLLHFLLVLFTEDLVLLECEDLFFPLKCAATHSSNIITSPFFFNFYNCFWDVWPASCTYYHMTCLLGFLSLSVNFLRSIFISCLQFPFVLFNHLLSFFQICFFFFCPL